jgi:hypothetical protein
MKHLPNYLLIVALLLFAVSPCLTIAADQPASPFPADGQPPKNATVLFNGKDISQWTNDKGAPCKWKVDKNEMLITNGGGSAISKHKFTNAMIHLEFNLPTSGQGHGNSGVYVHQLYELQIIDSFNKNKFAPGQQCGSLYKKHTPIKQMCKAPGQWQSYDILFRAATINKAGKLVTPAMFTVWHNGTLILKDAAMSKGTGGASKRPLVNKGPLLLQNHGAPVRFRNIWIQSIDK